MKKLFLLLFVFLNFFAISQTVGSQVNLNSKQVQAEFYANSIDNWVLVFMNGCWWWVIYNEDGSIKNQIPADF